MDLFFIDDYKKLKEAVLFIRNKINEFQRENDYYPEKSTAYALAHVKGKGNATRSLYVRIAEDITSLLEKKEISEAEKKTDFVDCVYDALKNKYNGIKITRFTERISHAL